MKIYNSQKNVDLSDILKIEKEFNFSYPDSYRQFLLDYNGGYPSKNELYINERKCILHYFIPIKYGNYNQEIVNNELTKSFDTINLYPFAIDNFGNYYSFNVKKEIIYWKILTKNQTKLTTNFDVFLQLFGNKENSHSREHKEYIIYKTHLGKSYTQEEWKAFEEEEYRKYVEKRSGKKSSFLADDTEEIKKQNFSAESGTLKEVKYFVMNSRQDKVPVYEFPSAMVAPISFLGNGTAIEIVKYEKDGWCEILSKDKKKAYIQSTHVKKNE